MPEPAVPLAAPPPARSPAPELPALARLEQLFDAGTFVELDAGVEHRAQAFGMASKRAPGDGVIVGFGQIDGRTAYAYSQDRAVLGGSLGEAHAQKIVKVMDLAGATGCPIIGINDSGGARIQEGVEALAGYGEIFRRNVRYSGVVPQISLVMGPCAGGAVYSPALTDFIIMVDRRSYMFVTGPKVVRAVTSEVITTESLGGGKVHAEQSGVAHFLVHNEVEGLDVARQLLAYLPRNNCDAPPESAPSDDASKMGMPAASTAPVDAVHALDDVPKEANKPYDMGRIVRGVCDPGSFLEVHARWATNVVTGFARLGGHSVGIVGNNPAVMAGVLDIEASRKAARFVRTCDAFGLPVVSLVDVPGFLPGKEQEHAGIISHGAKIAYAYCEASVPKITVILRKAYGGAYIVMGSKHVGGDLNFAWPQAEIAVMGAAGAVEILHAKELAHSDDKPALQRELTGCYTEQFCNTKVAQARGFIDAVIEPMATRQMLINAVMALAGKREPQPAKRHGNEPL